MHHRAPDGDDVPDTPPRDLTRLFTREEFRQAMGFLFEEDEAERMTRFVYEPDPDLLGMGVADGTLLALALLSDDAAEQVIAYRPEMEETVRQIRQDPVAVRASLRLDS